MGSQTLAAARPPLTRPFLGACVPVSLSSEVCSCLQGLDVCVPSGAVDTVTAVGDGRMAARSLEPSSRRGDGGGVHTGAEVQCGSGASVQNRAEGGFPSVQPRQALIPENSRSPEQRAGFSPGGTQVSR